MKVDYYISELLFTNDCVVVPGFGGFVANYAPAKIHPVNHTFYPPSKSILFNSKLLSDDGLLLHSISVAEELTYTDAKQKVDDFINESRQLLNDGKSVKLERIGIIRKDSDGRFLFDPDVTVNYLEESFSLPTFISPPILRPSMHKRLEKKFTDRRPFPEEVLKNKKKYWASVALVPVLLLIGWLIFSPELKFNSSQQLGVISFSDPEIENNQTHIISPDNISVTPLRELNFSDQNPLHDQAVKPENSSSQDQADSKVYLSKYYVIGGAFKNRENADKMLTVLRQEGYNAEDAGQNPVGLYMVSYFSSEDKSEALVNLGIIRNEKNPSAWLLKK